MTLSPLSALLVIDVQEGFNDPSWGERNNPDAEDAIANLLAAWRTAHRPVLHVHHDSLIETSPLRSCSFGNRVKPQAAPKVGEIVYRKHVNSCFIGTSLEADLRAAGIDTLVLVGLTTPHCISTTARMAANYGFLTHVVQDATAAFALPALGGGMRVADEVHRSALSDLQDEFAQLPFTHNVLEAVR